MVHCGLTLELLIEMTDPRWFPHWTVDYDNNLLDTRFPYRYGDQYPEGGRIDK